MIRTLTGHGLSSQGCGGKKRNHRVEELHVVPGTQEAPTRCAGAPSLIGGIRCRHAETGAAEAA